MVTAKLHFQWPDYLIFSLSCAMTVVIGAIFAIKDKWGSQSTESYLMGDRRMSWVMIGISTCASVISAVLFVGPLAETYYMGFQFSLMMLSTTIASVYTCIVTIPKFFRIGRNITSAYEYLEVRFNLPVRMLASGIYIFGTMFKMAVIMYAPCLILAQVSSLDIRLCVFIAGTVCMIYTGFGGMKAVVWVDNAQTLIIIAGLIAMLVKGLAAVSMKDAWAIYSATGRNKVIDTDIRPWDRHNIWNVMVIGWILPTSSYSTQQLLLQRFMSVKSIRNAQGSAMLSALLVAVFTFLVMIVAVLAFAQFGGNEPLLTQEINKRGQIFPYYLMRVLGHLPGLPGLLVAAAFAAALSSLSSGQNALAAVVLEDFFKTIYLRRTGRNLSESAAGKISRITGVVMGVIITGLGLLILKADDMVFTLVITMESMMCGPIFTLMLMAMFMPFVESWGALVGGICSLIWAIQMGIGSFSTSNDLLGYDLAPLYLNNFTQEVLVTPANVTATLYDTSYRWYIPMNLGAGLSVGIVVSLIVLTVKYRAAKRINRNASWKDGMSGWEYLYTRKDFFAAFGRSSPPEEKVIPKAVFMEMTDVKHLANGDVC